MKATIRLTLAGAVSALAAAAAMAQAPAAASAPAALPAGFVAPADPRIQDTAAERVRSQPGNNAPVWRAVRESGTQPGYSSLPGAEQGVLIQSAGAVPGFAPDHRRRGLAPGAQPLDHSLWRRAAADHRAGTGAVLLARGPLGGHQPDTGRQIERFTPFERAAHWANASPLSVLAVSGLVMAFGQVRAAAGDRLHAVRLAELRAQDRAQLRRVRCSPCRW
jgi:formate dehydrogenase subunit gamma